MFCKYFKGVIFKFFIFLVRHFKVKDCANSIVKSKFNFNCNTHINNKTNSIFNYIQFITLIIKGLYNTNRNRNLNIIEIVDFDMALNIQS